MLGTCPFLFLFFGLPLTVSLCLHMHSDLHVVDCWKLPGRRKQLCLLRSVCWLMQRLFYISGQVKLQLAASQREDKPWGQGVYVCVCVSVNQPVPMVVAFPKRAKSGG